MSSAVALLLAIHQWYTNQRVLLIKIAGVIFIYVFRFDAAFSFILFITSESSHGPLAGFFLMVRWQVLGPFPDLYK